MGHRNHCLASLEHSLEKEPERVMELLGEAYDAGYSRAREDLEDELYLRAEDRVRILFEEWKEGFAQGYHRAKGSL